MDNDLSAKGVLEIEAILKNAREVTRDIALLREGLNDASAAGDKLEKKSRTVEKGLEGVGKSAIASAAGLKQANAAWDKQDKIYNDYLNHQARATSSTMAASAAATAATTSFIAQRYALYDVASTYGIISATLLASAGYAVKVGAQFESAFTNVERTSDGTVLQIQAIRDGLVELSTQIPLTFQDLSKIASLGNQLGIAADDILGFTETIARFAAVSGLSVESVAESFGKISNLTGLATEDYEKFGSAVALVARNSAATEATLISTAKEIAASGEGAGFSAQAVVGLSGALASLAIAPERARGSLDTYFGTLNKAVAAGGEDLQNFSIVTGLAADEIDRLVRNGEGQKVFMAFLEGLNEFDNVGATQALDALNLSQLRVSNTFQRLSGNIPLVTKLFEDANSGFSSGTELASQYAKVVDDLNSRWMTFVNSVNALIEVLSGGAVTSVADMLAVLTDVVNKAREFADNPVARNMAQIVIGATAVVGVLFALSAAQALATASTYALVTAQTALTASGGTAGVAGLLKILTASMFTYTGAAAAATAANTTFAVSSAGVTTATASMVSVMGMLKSVIPVVGIQILANMMVNELSKGLYSAVAGLTLTTAGMGDLKAATDALNAGNMSPFVQDLLKTLEGVEQTGEGFNKFSYDVQNWIQGLTGLPLTASQYVASVDALNEHLGEADAVLAAMVSSGNGDKAADVVLALGLSASEAALRLPQYVAAAKAAAAATGLIGGALTGSGLKQGDLIMAQLKAQIDSVGEAAGGSGGGGGGGAAEKVRTLVDYANDLSQVFKRAFDIRFSGGEGLDAINSGWSTIRKSIADTNDQIAEYRATMMSLTADRAIKEYWLSVAENYGDVLRAGELRAELADIDKDLKKTTGDLTKAQDKNSKTLVGNSDAAIANRAEILGLVTDYQGYIAALASSGLNQDQLRIKTAQLKADFIAQATQLGYNQAELGQYANAFDDVTTAINNIPRDITVDFNPDPALQAINEFVASAQAALNAGGGLSVPVTVNDEALKKYARGAAILAAQQAALAIAANPNEPASRRVLYASRADELSLIYNSGNYWTGGYVGDGGKYEPKGIVHGGEFVFSKKAVQNIGVGNLAYAHNMAKSGAGFSGGGSVGGAGMTPTYTQLSPTDRQLLIDVKDAINNKPLLSPVGVAAASSAVANNGSTRRSA